MGGTQAIVLALLRGCHVAALASLFGTLVSLALVAPAGLREAGAAAALTARRRLVRLALWSDALAIALGLLWLLLEAATMAGTTSIGATFGVLGTVLSATQFGRLIAVRLLLLLVALPCLTGRGWRLGVAALLTGGALAMQGLLGHAGATPGPAGTTLIASESLHLLAAGAWLGGLLPLLLLARALPPAAAATVCERFSPVGLSAVVAIACTAVVQAWILIGGPGALFGTAYGHIALLKLTLFFLLLLLAAINRFVLTNRMRDPARPATRRCLQISLALEATLGATIIVVAAFLASGMPAMDATPVWPFAWRPSLQPLSRPGGRLLLFHGMLPSLAAAILTAVIVLVAAGVAAGRGRRLVLWPALAVLVICLALALPRLQALLTVPAYPSTFDTPPDDFASTGIARGATLFQTDCAACHGAGAEGQGLAAGTPAAGLTNLTAPQVWTHTEGDLYWFVAHGFSGRSGAPAMPAFAERLPSDAIWAAIDFLQARDAGHEMRTTGRWQSQVPLPRVDAVCADGSAVDAANLRGEVVHIIAAANSVMPSPPPPGIKVATIVLARDSTVKPLGTACVAAQPGAWQAFAILAGVPADELTGTQMLADTNGWLRLRWQPGEAGNWDDPRELEAVIRRLAAHPRPGTPPENHAHPH